MSSKKLFFILGFSLITMFSSSQAFAQTPTETVRFFFDALQVYYKTPKPEIVAKAIPELFKSKDFFEINNERYFILLAGLSCLYDRHPDYASDWKKQIASQQNSEFKETLLNYSTLKTNDIFNKTDISPVKNDMNWICFFVSGNKKYVDDIVAALAHIDNRTEILKFTAAVTAKWSLTANKNDNYIVDQAILSYIASTADKPKHVQQQALELLTFSEDDIQKQMKDGIKEGQDKNSWIKK